MTGPVRGLLLVDGEPVGGQPVLLLSSAPLSVLAATETGADGRFSMEPATDTGPDGDVMILARVSTSVLAVAVAADGLPRADTGGGAAAGDGAGGVGVELAVDTARLVAVTCRIAVQGRRPPFVSLTVDALRLDGVPDVLGPLLRRRNAQVVDAHFFSRNLESDSIDLLVQPGVYRLNASHVDRSRPNVIAPAFDNLVTDLVSAGSRSVGAESLQWRRTRNHWTLRARLRAEGAAGRGAAQRLRPAGPADCPGG